jgi:hypothetical protein
MRSQVWIAYRSLITSLPYRRQLFLVGIVLVALLGTAGWLANATVQEPRGPELWQEETPVQPITLGQESRRIFRLDTLALRRLLAGAPEEAYREADDREAELTLPLPDGAFQRFRIEESPVIDGALAARYPEIKTYRGYAIDDPTITMRCDLTPQGFHATILYADRLPVTIHPERQDPQITDGMSVPPARYHSYYGSAQGDGEVPFTCQMLETADSDPLLERYAQTAVSLQSGSQLRTYRIAIATTWEYANYTTPRN